MISKSKIKFIHSLEQKKFRKESKMFVAEGHKLVEDLLPAFECTYLTALTKWLETHEDTVETLRRNGVEVQATTPEELQKTSLLKHPQDVIALFCQREEHATPANVAPSQLCLALDGVQDPGNVGTIIRLADWFGIEHIFCSPDTADIYNPKTVQATMGALARVHVHYLPLAASLAELPPQTPVYGTFLEGKDLYAQPLSQTGVIIMGNEGNGISPEVGHLVNSRLYIPNFPPGRFTSESLNVATATAIVCAEFRRSARLSAKK